MSERRTYHQSEHEAINAREYPGTRQLCSICDQPTHRCEEDELRIEDDGPFCEECYIEQKNKNEDDELDQSNH